MKFYVNGKSMEGVHMEQTSQTHRYNEKIVMLEYSVLLFYWIFFLTEKLTTFSQTYFSNSICTLLY